jgi:alkylation response protein AidB-like acyl-CoA dehydrogenase
MDFEHRYTKEQASFRQEVSSWLDSNIPDGFLSGSSPDITSGHYWNKYNVFRASIGSRGWLTPNQSLQHGGAGLTPDKTLVLVEEMERRSLLWVLDLGTSALAATIRDFGTEYQRLESLPFLSKGEITLWYPANLDPSVEIGSSNLTASLNGDDFVLSGESALYGYHPFPSHLWVIASTDYPVSGTNHTAAFLIPSNFKGLVFEEIDTLSQAPIHKVLCNEVWVPSICLIGKDIDDHSNFGSADNPQNIGTVPKDDDYVSDLINYANETPVSGQALIEHPIFKQLLMEIYTSNQVLRILKVRNSWMMSTGQPMSYEKTQVTLLEKRHSQRLAQVTRDVMGIYALLDTEDGRSIMRGKALVQQKRSLSVDNHYDYPDRESEEITKHLGLGTTKSAST